MFATKYCLVIGHSGDGGGDYIALHLRTVLVEIDDNYKSQHIFCLFLFLFVFFCIYLPLFVRFPTEFVWMCVFLFFFFCLCFLHLRRYIELTWIWTCCSCCCFCFCLHLKETNCRTEMYVMLTNQRQFNLHYLFQFFIQSIFRI